MEIRRKDIAWIISRAAIALLILIIVFKPETMNSIVIIILRWLEVMFNKMIDHTLHQISTRF